MTRPDPRFRTTRWTLVSRAAGEGPEAQAALGELLEAYWYPLYGFLRRQGADDAAARDGVQDFLAHAMGQDLWSRADPERGRFRSFLLGALQKRQANRQRAAATERQGGAVLTLSFDAGDGRFEPADHAGSTPEAAFDRLWAEEVLERARQRLRTESIDRGRERMFVALEDTLDGGPGSRSHLERAGELGVTEGAVKVAAHRLRRRLGELIREEVAQTLGSSLELEDELGLLFKALGGAPGAAAKNSSKPGNPGQESGERG